MIAAPPVSLRFTEYEGYIYYMDSLFYDRLLSVPLEVEIPIIQGEELRMSEDSIRCGYRFKAPRSLTRVNPNYVMVAKESNGAWEPLLGLPGIQIYAKDTGVCLISTRITSFLNRL